MTFKSLISLAACLGLFAACSSNSSKNTQEKLNAQENVERQTGQIPESPEKQRDDYAQKVQNRINDFNQRIRDLQVAGGNQPASQQPRTEALTEALQLRTQDLQQSLNAMKSAPAGQWERFREDVDNNLAKAEDAYNTTKQVATRK